MSGSSPTRSPMMRTRTLFWCSSARSLRTKRRNSPIRSRTSDAGRDQFSELKENRVRIWIPSSPTTRTVRRNASTPRRCPSPRGSPRSAAQRPFPSIMMATWRNGSKPESGFLVDTAISGIRFSSRIMARLSPGSDCHYLFFFGSERLIDFAYGLIGRLLHLGGHADMVVLADLSVFFKFLQEIERIATNMANGDARCFGIFVRNLDHLLAAILIELRDSQPQHLAFGRGGEAEIGIDDRLLNGVHHGAVPHLHAQQPRLRHADSGELIERHVGAIGLDLHRFEQARRSAAGAQPAELLLEHLGGAVHAALDVVDV